MKFGVPTAVGVTEVVVTEPVFVDKAGERLRIQPTAHGGFEPLLPLIEQTAPVARPSASVRLAVMARTTRLSIRAGPAGATLIGLALGVLLPTVPCR